MNEVLGIVSIALLIVIFVCIVREWDPDETCEPGEHCETCTYFPCEKLTGPDTTTDAEIVEK